MNCSRRLSFEHLLLVFVCVFVSSFGDVHAQSDVRDDFQQWAQRNLHPVDAAASETSLRHLGQIKAMIGDAKIVTASEPVHGAAEPLEFRNGLFRFLVEELGFEAIALESGVVEGRVLNEYVVDGKGDVDGALKQGFSWTFGEFPQNRELLRWMREYNARLPAGRTKVQVFGFDVAGSPGNLSAVRGPDTALEVALGFLRTVDPEHASRITARIASSLPKLKRSNYGEIAQADRDALTSSIEELISLIQHRRFQYLAKSSSVDYDWAERAALAARQVDVWWRHMPVGWKPADGYEWMRDASQTRERAMADNLRWIVDRLDPNAHILMFGAVSHMATSAFRFPDAPQRDMYPFGAYAKAEFGAKLISVMTMVAGGEIAFCLGETRKTAALKPPPATAVESHFASLDVPRYLLDLRTAPPSVADWLSKSQDHWNGFGITKLPTSRAFDIAYFAGVVRPACSAR